MTTTLNEITYVETKYKHRQLAVLSNSVTTNCIVLDSNKCDITELIDLGDGDIQSFENLIKTNDSQYIRKPLTMYDLIIVFEKITIDMLAKMLSMKSDKCNVVLFNLVKIPNKIQKTQSQRTQEMNKFSEQDMASIFGVVFASPPPLADINEYSELLARITTVRDDYVGENCCCEIFSLENAVNLYVEKYIDGSCWKSIRHDDLDITDVVRRRLHGQSSPSINVLEGDFIFLKGSSAGERKCISSKSYTYRISSLAFDFVNIFNFYGITRLRIERILINQAVLLSDIVDVKNQIYCKSFNDREIACHIFYCSSRSTHDVQLLIFRNCRVDFGSYSNGCQRNITVTINDQTILSIESIHYSIFKNSIQEMLFRFSTNSFIKFAYEYDDSEYDYIYKYEFQYINNDKIKLIKNF